MHTRSALTRWMALLTALLLLTACGGRDPDADEIPDLKPETGAEQSPEITDITEDNFDEAFYVGRTVSLTGTVTKVITPTSFVLTGREYDDDSILVLSAEDATVRRGQQITVTGEVQRFRYPNYRGYELDDDDSYGEYDGEEFLVASGISEASAPPSNPPRVSGSGR